MGRGLWCVAIVFEPRGDAGIRRGPRPWTNPSSVRRRRRIAPAQWGRRRAGPSTESARPIQRASPAPTTCCSRKSLFFELVDALRRCRRTSLQQGLKPNRANARRDRPDGPLEPGGWRSYSDLRPPNYLGVGRVHEEGDVPSGVYSGSRGLSPWCSSTPTPWATSSICNLGPAYRLKPVADFAAEYLGYRREHARMTATERGAGPGEAPRRGDEPWGRPPHGPCADGSGGATLFGRELRTTLVSRKSYRR